MGFFVYLLKLLGLLPRDAAQMHESSARHSSFHATEQKTQENASFLYFAKVMLSRSPLTGIQAMAWQRAKVDKSRYRSTDLQSFHSRPRY